MVDMALCRRKRPQSSKSSLQPNTYKYRATMFPRYASIRNALLPSWRQGSVRCLCCCWNFATKSPCIFAVISWLCSFSGCSAFTWTRCPIKRNLILLSRPKSLNGIQRTPRRLHLAIVLKRDCRFRIPSLATKLRPCLKRGYVVFNQKSAS